MRSALQRYTTAAGAAAGEVIRTYSTSFGIATRLLGERHRTHVRNIYAMVRVADEIVDGVAEAAGLTASEQRQALDAYEAATYEAMATGFSTDLILHAFAHTARAASIDRTHTEPFFASMRADLTRSAHTEQSHADYVYGSAEVVGLMCTQVFLRGRTYSPEQLATIHHGARQLGAAFQNVNFLRDLGDDTGRLQRSYLSEGTRLTDADRNRWVATIRGQLADAEASIPLLPKDARAAVRTAAWLFASLTDRIERTPAEVLYRRRVRVPDAEKLAIAARAVARTAKGPR